MKKGVLIVGFVLGIIALAVAYYLISPLFIVVEMDENFPSDSQNMTEEEMMSMTLLEGEFMPSAHEVMGNAKVIESDGKKFLRFENFETVNGPNLHIWLASDTSGKDYVDLGEIKATKGNVNYEIPEGADLEKYNKVLVWCVPFRVLFSYADLN